MSGPLMKVEGIHGVAALYEQGVVIQGTGMKGSKRTQIPLSEIETVEFKPAGTGPLGLNPGYIQFVCLGETPKTGVAVNNDENSLMFKRNQQPAFEQLKAAVEDRLAKLGPRSLPAREKTLMEAVGQNGQLQLRENTVVIRREGFAALAMHGLKGDKHILLSQVSSVQFKRVGSLSAMGYIQFAFVGGREAKGGMLEAGTDENTVTFNSQQQRAFERIYSAIKERMETTGAARETKPPSSLDELGKLAELRDKGIVTEEEFQQKKRQLLGL